MPVANRSRSLRQGSVAALLSLSCGLVMAVSPARRHLRSALKTLDGKAFSLAGDFKGRWVALEWVNPECPFVQKHYNSGNMQETQRFAAASKVV